MSFYDIPYELLIYISEFLDLPNKLNFKASCKLTKKYILITDFYNIPEKFIQKLSDKIISAYPNLASLCASRSLDESKGGAITDNSIIKLTNLTKLDVFHNNNITVKSIKHLTNLTKLRARDSKHITSNIFKSSPNCKLHNIPSKIINKLCGGITIYF